MLELKVESVPHEKELLVSREVLIRCEIRKFSLKVSLLCESLLLLLLRTHP